ncbi:hypothetical protein ACFL2V_14690 [Pseudomonadota bacterium]
MMLNTKHTSTSPQHITSQIQKAYSKLSKNKTVSIVESLNQQPHTTTLLFGGFIRDLLIKKKNQDIDFKCVVPKQYFFEQHQNTENILKQKKINFKKVQVYDNLSVFSWMSGSKTKIDLAITSPKSKFFFTSSHSQEKAIVTPFTLNSIYYDIHSHQSFVLYEGLKHLLKRKVILCPLVRKTDPNYSSLAFRLTYLLSKHKHFSTNSETIKILLNSSYKKKDMHRFTQTYLFEKNDINFRYLFNQIFGGLKSRPHEYLRNISLLKLERFFLQVFASQLGIKITTIPTSNSTLHFTSDFKTNVQRFLTSFFVQNSIKSLKPSSQAILQTFRFYEFFQSQ